MKKKCNLKNSIVGLLMVQVLIVSASEKKSSEETIIENVHAEKKRVKNDVTDDSAVDSENSNDSLSEKISSADIKQSSYSNNGKVVPEDDGKSIKNSDSRSSIENIKSIDTSKKSPYSYKPSEKISEDLSVAFPVDI